MPCDKINTYGYSAEEYSFLIQPWTKENKTWTQAMPEIESMLLSQRICLRSERPPFGGAVFGVEK